jgi:hypothetical protein
MYKELSLAPHNSDVQKSIYFILFSSIFQLHRSFLSAGCAGLLELADVKYWVDPPGRRDGQLVGHRSNSSADHVGASPLGSELAGATTHREMTGGQPRAGTRSKGQRAA